MTAMFLAVRMLDRAFAFNVCSRVVDYSPRLNLPSFGNFPVNGDVQILYSLREALLAWKMRTSTNFYHLLTATYQDLKQFVDIDSDENRS